MGKDSTLHRPFADVKTFKPIENNCIYKSLFEPNRQRAGKQDLKRFTE